ncbi:MAG: site-specific DNA-methyltransferase, partial [Clostridia bacterium]|nr:site-specific DNA-methyltransferase [Clostridia bacterium]
PWNFIIEGDNLQALYLLEKTHRGKVDCIYIDPPYNTGARDWKYNNDYVDGNDQYRHSKWLSMMKSRLLVAKRLLNPRDSVLIVTIDEKEYLHLGCLLEELFPEAKMQMISSVINPSGVAREGEFYRTDEYLFILRFGICIPNKLALSEEWLTAKTTGKDSVRWRPIRRQGSHDNREDAPNQFFPIFLSEDGSHIIGTGRSLLLDEKRESVQVPSDCITVWPLKPDNREGCWQISQESIKALKEQGFVKVSYTKKWGFVPQYLAEGEREKVKKGLFPIIGRDVYGTVLLNSAEGEGAPFIPGTQWRISSHSAREQGASLLNKLFPDKRFSFPKSLYAVHDAIRFFVSSKPDATILDFFAGSGTTMHAVNLLNAEDGGHRRCIMVTNNEVSEAEAKSMKEKGLNPGDPEWEALGIARYVTWPRTVCSIEGHDINGNPLKGNYLGSDIPMADGFNANVKYFKCDWTPRKPEEYLLSNALCLHIKEMIELRTAREVDGEKVVLILSKEDYHRIFDDPAAAEKAQDVWVNENLFFNNAEMRVLRDKHFKYIPRVFFSQELKEAGEYV